MAFTSRPRVKKTTGERPPKGDHVKGKRPFTGFVKDDPKQQERLVRRRQEGNVRPQE